MRRTRLALIAVLVWLAVEAGILAFAALAGPSASGLFGIGALTLLGIALTFWIAWRAETRHRAGVSALGEAVGAGPIGDANERDHIQAIAANLCARLERALVYKAGFEALDSYALIADAKGSIVKASAGLYEALGTPDTLQAAFGPGIALKDTPQTTEVHALGRALRARSVPLSGGRWLVELDRPGTVVAANDLAAFTDALTSGQTGFRFAADRLRANPDLEVFNTALAALDQSVAAIRKLIETEGRAEIAPSNTGFAREINALASALCELAGERDMEAQLRARDRERLTKVGKLVELCAARADALMQSADAAKRSAAAARDALTQSRTGASALVEKGATARAQSEKAGAVARANLERLSEVQALTERIDGLMGAIEDISFRTNLLALNAAVEAARAGDKGAGFAVVAAEVRELAQASTRSSKDVRALIKKGLSSGEADTAQADALARLLEDIDAHLLNLSDETQMIGSALGSGAEAVETAVAEITAIKGHAEDQHAALTRAGDAHLAERGDQPAHGETGREWTIAKSR